MFAAQYDVYYGVSYIIIMSNKCLIIAFFVSQEGQISYHRKDTLNFLDKSG